MSALRHILGLKAPLWLAGLYALSYATEWFLGHYYGVTALMLLGRFILIAIMILIFGWIRAVRFYPVSHPGYAEWLATTPWSDKKPLPFGPALLTWWDMVIVMAAAGIMTMGVMLTVGTSNLLPAQVDLPDNLLKFSHFLSDKNSNWKIMADTAWWCLGITCCLFLVGHALPANIQLTSQKWIRRGVMAMWPLTVYPEFNILQCLAVLIIMTSLSQWGKARCLRQLPYDTVNLDQEPVEKIRKAEQHLTRGSFGNVAPDPHTQEPSWLVLLANRVVAAWWLMVIASLFFGGAHAAGDLLVDGPYDSGVYVVWWILVLVMLFARVQGYLNPFKSPITLKGRIRTGQLILPRFDQVFVVPCLIVLIGCCAPSAIAALGTPHNLIVGLSVFLLLAVTRFGPPSLQTWSRTGQHRIGYKHEKMIMDQDNYP